MPRPTKTWRAVERAIARLLGGRRCHFEGKDVDAGEWSVEVKHGRQVPKTIIDWFGQAEQNAGDRKRPLLVLHPAGAAYADSLAVLRLADLAEPHPVRRKGAETETDGVWATPDR